MRLKLGLILAIFAVALNANAEDKSGSVSVGANVGAAFHIGAGSVDDATSEGPSYGGVLKYHFTENFALGAGLDGLNSREHRAVSPIVSLLGFYNLMPDEVLSPIVSLGLGPAVIDANMPSASDGTYTSLAYQAGLGLEYFINSQLSVQPYAKFHWIPTISTHDREFQTINAGAGLTYYFGQGKKSEPMAAAPTSEPTQTTEPTRYTEPVELDSDNDGILDKKDRCPLTPTGNAVDKYGCPVSETVTIDLKVEFQPNKADIQSQYHDKIAEVANFMKAYPEATGMVEGHTDSQGPEAYNQSLSEKRADSVKQYLNTHFGIATDRLQAIGFGESQPFADNATRAGRQQNRRVILKLNQKRWKKR